MENKEKLPALQANRVFYAIVSVERVSRLIPKRIKIAG